jgi:cytochrome c
MVLLVATAAHAQDATRGEQLYAECAACHPLEAGLHGVGPTLHDIIGRKAGGYDDYRYSPALRRSGLTWSVEALDTLHCRSAGIGARQPHAL